MNGIGNIPRANNVIRRYRRHSLSQKDERALHGVELPSAVDSMMQVHEESPTLRQMAEKFDENKGEQPVARMPKFETNSETGDLEMKLLNVSSGDVEGYLTSEELAKVAEHASAENEPGAELKSRLLDIKV